MCGFFLIRLDVYGCVDISYKTCLLAVFFSLVSFWFVCMFRSEALLSFRGTNIQYFSRPSRSLSLGCGIVCVEHPLVASVCFLDKLLCFWNIPSIHLLFYTIDCTRLFYKNRTLFIVFQITCTFNFQWRHICLLLFLCNCRIWKCVLYIQQHILLKHIYGCMLWKYNEIIKLDNISTKPNLLKL